MVFFFLSRMERRERKTTLIILASRLTQQIVIWIMLNSPSTRENFPPLLLKITNIVLHDIVEAQACQE